MTYRSVPLGKLCRIEKGATGIMKAVAGPYPMVTLAEERTSHNEYQFDAKAVIVPLISSTGHGHASMKRVHYQEGKFALGSILCALIPNDETELNARFLYNYLSFFKDSLLVPLMRGAANVSLSIKSISSVTIPLPPLDEQLAINELVDDYSIKTKACQAELQTQQTLLTKLRQAILQEAVQGKLTKKFRETERFEQHLPVTQGVPSASPVRTATQPETGADLLARIRAEKAELIRQGKLRKEKPLPPITDAEKPFDLPEEWVWCRLGELCIFGPTNGFSPKPSSNETETKCLTLTATTSGYFQRDKFKYVDEIVSKDSSLWLINGDILIQRGNSLEYVGIAAIYDGPDFEFIYPDLMMKIQLSKFISVQYIHYYLINPFCRAYFMSKASGAQKTMPKINQANVSETLVAIPPFKEQESIVAQIELLLAQTSALDVENKQQQDEVGRLMQVVLREAFAEKETVNEQLPLAI